MMDVKLDKYLDGKNKDELKMEIQNLCNGFLEVKKFYELKLNKNYDEKLLDEYKIQIKDLFCNCSNLQEIKYSSVGKYIRDFSEYCKDKKYIIDLMLFYVELSLDYNKKNTYYEELYLSVESVFDKALNNIFKYRLNNFFKDKISYILEKSKYINKDFNKDLLEMYYSYIEDKI